MPVIGRDASVLIRPRQSPYDPTVPPDFPSAHRVIIPMEETTLIPSNFDELSPEEQEVIVAKYRFWGIRLRNDLAGTSVKISRQTMDIP